MIIAETVGLIPLKLYLRSCRVPCCWDSTDRSPNPDCRRPAAVPVSPDDFEGWRETIAIKADGDLMYEIKKGSAALGKKPKVYTLEKLFE